DEGGFLNPLKLPGLEVSLVPMTNEALPERPRYPSDVLPLAGADRVVRAGIVLSVVKTDLRSALEKAVTLVAAGALVLALALGAVVARRITRPVRELARGAGEIAAGRLDVRLASKPSSDELWDLGGGFKPMTEALARYKERLGRAERVAAWREIARRIAHEIKNPLTPIQMSIETMRRTRDRPAEFQEIFDEGTRTILDEVA